MKIWLSGEEEYLWGFSGTQNNETGEMNMGQMLIYRIGAEWKVWVIIELEWHSLNEIRTLFN